MGNSDQGGPMSRTLAATSVCSATVLGLTLTLLSATGGAFAQAMNPVAPLVQGTRHDNIDDTNSLYGTTLNGGYVSPQVNRGTVFKINRDGSGYMSLHTFTSNTPSGEWPKTGLTLSADGAHFYGVAAGEPNNGIYSSLFDLSTATTPAHYEEIGFTSPPIYFYGSFVEVNDPASGGDFYYSASNLGIVKWTPGNPHKFTVVSPTQANALTYLPDGKWLWIVASGGGTNRVGFIARMHPDGSGYQVVFNFDPDEPGNHGGI